jgi:hypothetical protein
MLIQELERIVASGDTEYLILEMGDSEPFAVGPTIAVMQGPAAPALCARAQHLLDAFWGAEYSLAPDLTEEQKYALRDALRALFDDCRAAFGWASRTPTSTRRSCSPNRACPPARSPRGGPRCRARKG